MFADAVTERIKKTKSFLCAGIDPDLNLLPGFLLKSKDPDGGIESALSSFSKIAIDSVKAYVACIKPNTAFFEQYGISGLKALGETLSYAKSLSIPIIIDAKRGDIGNTASAYSNAYLLGATLKGKEIPSPFVGDALTVSPFLGFDSLAPFLEACRVGKGVFVLVKTSNQGSGDIQGVGGDAGTVSQKIAKWVSETGSEFTGTSGYSNLCAVVGGTYPEELKSLRELMPNTIFLVPGFGAQGGKASDVRRAFDKRGGGVICNASRALFGEIPADCKGRDDLVSLFSSRAKALRDELNENC